MNNTYLRTRRIILIALFAALTSLLAYVSIPLPFSPVPITGQTLGVMLAGLLLSGSDALLSQVVYILLGVFGLPVFSGGSSGIGVLFGPSGGFIIGFLAAAFFIGKFTGKETGFKNDIMVLFLGGIVIIYITGIIQLMLVLDLSLKAAFMTGALPYLPGGIIKIMAAVAMGNKIKQVGIIKKE